MRHGSGLDSHHALSLLTSSQSTEQVPGVDDDGPTQAMIDSFGVSLKDGWSNTCTKQHLEAVAEAEADEKAKEELALLGERCVV